MFSYALSTASTYFHLPIDEEEDADIEKYERKYLTWVVEPAGSAPLVSQAPSPAQDSNEVQRISILQEVLECNDLYDVLGLPKSTILDKATLRRAYLSRSKACHPDKFPGNPDATRAFQKVTVAYDILSKPSSKRVYDSRPPSSDYDAFAARPARHADDTLRGVVLGAFNDFLDGDLEPVKTLLKAINDINPSLGLGDDGVASILEALHVIRERALTCRTCICALHAEVERLLEIKNTFQKLSYFDIMGRTRLTVQLTRITITLPITLEKALHDRDANAPQDTAPKSLWPRHVTILIRGVDVVLERMERILR